MREAGVDPLPLCMTIDTKQVEYAPLDSLGKLLDDGPIILNRMPGGYRASVSRSEREPASVTAPTLGLLVRALELLAREGTDLSSVTVGPDGGLVGAGKREAALWAYIRRSMGPVLELREMPGGAPGPERARELARQARFLGEEANGFSLPDHLLVRAGAALDVALRGAESGYMPSAALLTDYIADQFEQSGDGETDVRKQMIWEHVDVTPRFGLPQPWDDRMGRIAAAHGGSWDCFRGGVEGERFLATRVMAVRVDEDTYQAAAKCDVLSIDGHTTRKTTEWSAIAGLGDCPEPLALDGERLQLDHKTWAVRVGPVWINERYAEFMRELGAEQVFIGKDGLTVVAPGIAAVMPLSPDSIAKVQADGPTPDPRPKPEVGQRYIVTTLSLQALIRITYKSDQRLLAVCEGRRRSTEEPWHPDGSEAEWSTTYGEWRLATEGEAVW